MAVKHGAAVHPPTGQRVRPGLSLLTIAAWVLGIAGAVAAFLGTFILVAGEEQSVGLGGEWVWQVGEIEAAWSYGLLIGGVVLLLVAVALYVAGRNAARDGRAMSRGLTDVVLHAVAFTLVNAVLWLQDLAMGGGLEYAYWVTIPWGLGLAAHVGAYYVATRRRAMA